MPVLDARSCHCGHTLFSVDLATSDVVCANWKCNAVIGRLAGSEAPPHPQATGTVRSVDENGMSVDYSDEVKRAMDGRDPWASAADEIRKKWSFRYDWHGLKPPQPPQPPPPPNPRMTEQWSRFVPPPPQRTVVRVEPFHFFPEKP